MRAVLFLLLLGLSPSCLLAQAGFEHPLRTDSLPWTSRSFDNAPDQFQFAIVSDRTGGHRAGIFGDAMQKLNLLHPEFVMSVGDLIEGYTKDTAVLHQQWAEFDSILSVLDMRFFALPGNHDISNDVMRQLWLDRYGASYYHFRYKDVLFLAFDSNDGDGVVFSREQLDYFKKAIAENADVRWTLLFMHHPIWNYREFNGFTEIEEVLKGRPYTVFAGHTHRYFKNTRQGQKYYVLSTTGGGSRLRSPRLGEFDHISWVTMTENGPDVVHLQLKGIIEEDVLNENTAPVAMALHNASQVEQLLLRTEGAGVVAYLRIANTLDGKSEQVESSGLFAQDQALSAISKSLRFEGRFYHHHQLAPEQLAFDLQIPADSAIQLAIPLRFSAESGTEIADPLELDWAAGFAGDPFDPAFELSGILDIPVDFEPAGLSFTELDVFLDHHQVALSTPFTGLDIRYTLDGSEPGPEDALYEGLIKIDATTTIKARYFDAGLQASSAVAEKTYRKVKPYPALELERSGLEPGLQYAYYEGEFSEQLPDFSTLTPLRKGVALYSNPDSIAHRLDHFALVYEGYLEVPADGIYTFYTRSDDGSQLFIQDELVVDNDGSHSARTRYGHVALKAGLHPIRVAYFEDFLGESLEIGYETKDQKRRKLPFAELYHQK